MKINQITLTDSTASNETQIKKLFSEKPQLVFAFGGVNQFSSSKSLAEVISKKENATLIGCSALGEISGSGVTDNQLVLTALTFDVSVKMKTAHSAAANSQDSFQVGQRIAQQLLSDDLSAIFVLAPGVDINGSQMTAGLREVVGNKIVITGGLAGDGANFKQTWTILDEKISDRNVVAVGFYGKNLKVGFGSAGGWKPFGPARRVSKSTGNILYAIDGEPALDIYKKYLGDKSKELPSSGLLYPFEVVNQDKNKSGLIRTILGIDEAAGSLTLAGDVEEGSYLRLMHSNLEGLVSGAQESATKAFGQGDKSVNSCSVLISCVGRKIVMADDIEEEVDAVKSIFGNKAAVTGFYSHGEICPIEDRQSQLHNQTMTITHFTEIA